jgi:hypothetical protein
LKVLVTDKTARQELGGVVEHLSDRISMIVANAILIRAGPVPVRVLTGQTLQLSAVGTVKGVEPPLDLGPVDATWSAAGSGAGGIVFSPDTGPTTTVIPPELPRPDQPAAARAVIDLLRKHDYLIKGPDLDAPDPRAPIGERRIPVDVRDVHHRAERPSPT